MSGWIKTYSGIQFDLENPTADMIRLEDIAQGLSNICRFVGQCNEFYSVAQHSCLVSLHTFDIIFTQRMFCDEWIVPILRAAILHDASEAYLGDISRPLKHEGSVVGREYQKVEKVVQDAIYERFGCKYNDIIDVADKALLFAEANLLLNGGTSDWTLPHPGEKFKYKGRIEPLSPSQSKEMFLHNAKLLGVK